MNYSTDRSEYSNFKDIFKIVVGNQRKTISVIVLIQISLGFLDLFGVALVGMLTTIAATGYRTQSPNEGLNAFLTQFGVSNLTLTKQVILLGIVATILLIVKTFLSIFFTRKILIYFGDRGAFLSYNLVNHLLQKKLTFVISRRTQELVFSLTQGVESLTLQVVATFVVIIADFSLLIMMLSALIILDPLLALLCFVLFLSLASILYASLHDKSGYFGNRYTSLDIQSKEKIVEAIKTYREAVVRNTRRKYALRIRELRIQTSRSSAELAFLPYISKYTMEMSLIIVAALVAAASLFLKDSSSAIATLAVFLVAGSRLMPSLLRINQGLLQIRASLGTATPTLDLISQFELASGSSAEFSESDINYFSHLDNKTPRIDFRNVDYVYPGTTKLAVADLTFEIKAGDFTAIVGPSGSGKSTLVDLMLGILSPTSGEVELDGEETLSVISRFPGTIGYVPQDVYVTNGTFRQNLCLGYDSTQFPDEYLHDILQQASLSELLTAMPAGLDSLIGESGYGMSGGEKQRLGIARSLLSKPSLLILDESTSALDSHTEAQIMETISKFKKKKTLVVIAHRLSTIRNADTLIYLEDGRICAFGNFEKVKKESSRFAEQARLMGF